MLFSRFFFVLAAVALAKDDSHKRPSRPAEILECRVRPEITRSLPAEVADHYARMCASANCSDAVSNFCEFVPKDEEGSEVSYAPPPVVQE